MSELSATLSGPQAAALPLRWLNWFGPNNPLRLGWSCWLNRGLVEVVGQTFEGIANTRRSLLLHWFEAHWNNLEALARQLAPQSAAQQNGLLAAARAQTVDFSELFVIDGCGVVTASTERGRIGAADLNAEAVAAGLRGPFLHGPYRDAQTERLGASSSKFHDAVTLMFYQPLQRGGKTIGCLCARVPNDVMSDLIQREAGHVYRDSGDNYVFMVESRFDSCIEPGTALSRSRFEDDSFTLGDNLRHGVRTAFGTVRVQRHTELELRFIDPATGDLHPGVAATIRNGANLDVRFPGYPDYRHIPVIGKGITFQVPGSPDRWGMMCEADLEEVYRRRSLGYRVLKRGGVLAALAACALAFAWPSLSAPVPIALGLAAGGAAFLLLCLTALLPFSRRIDAMSRFLLGIAECGQPLDRRLDWDALKADEPGELGRWINSFLDKIDDTVSNVLGVARRVGQATASLSETSAQVAVDSNQQSSAAAAAAEAVQQISRRIGAVAADAGSAEDTSRDAGAMAQDGKRVVLNAAHEMQQTAASIAQLSERIATLDQRSAQISKILSVIKVIADQTNLLALNAAIEAARAGDSGKGFAVVASEVRNLSYRTAESTGEIAGMIRAIQEETQRAVETMQICREQAQRGVALAAQAGSALERIDSGASETCGRISDIAAVTRDQISTGEEIAAHVAAIAAAASRNSDEVMAAAQATSNLEQLARDLQRAVNKFSV